MAPRLLRFRLFSLSIFLLALSAIAATGQTVSFSSSPNPSAAAQVPAILGVAYRYDANAHSDDGGEVQYSLRFGPSGMAIHSQTGVVSWQPTEEGEFDVEIRAELVDDPSINATQRWKIAVSAPVHHPGCTGNEAWLTVGQGIPGSAVAATEMGGELYVLHRTDRYPRVFQISKWNGTYWNAVTDLAIADFGPIKMVAYNNELYVAAHPHYDLGIPDNRGLMKWDGTSWSGVGTNNFTDITDMTVVDGSLYVLGINTSSVQELARWDGTSWETLYSGASGVVWGNALAGLNGKLYVACRPTMMGLDYDELPLFELVNDVLTPVANRRMDFTNDYPTLGLIPHNGELIFLINYRLIRWDGTGTKVIAYPESTFLRDGHHSEISYKGQLYLALWPAAGATPMLLDYEIWRLDDDSWTPVSGIQGLVDDLAKSKLEFIEHKGDLYSYGYLTQSCGAVLNNVAVLGTENEVAKISGSVYHDDNRNCTVDQNEPTLKEEIIEILPGPFYTITNDAGEYTTLLRPGTYSLSVRPKRNWVASCPLPEEVTLSAPAILVEDVNLGTDMIPGIHDVRSSVANSQPRPGFDFTYTISYSNSGTEPVTGTLTFEYDNRLSYVSSAATADRQNGNTLEWDFANLPIGASVTVTVTMNVPASMVLGTELCASTNVELERKTDEEFLSDNRDSTCVTVTGAYDPNDIRVAPARFDEELMEAPLLPGDTVLSYMVRFQNTGTDTAFTVIVADTLDASLLDIASIRLGAASHDYDFNISGSGILTWTFKDIMLPDSGINELASHGYFKYTIQLKRGLAPMTTIPNRAAIYFDYNAPVITNTVLSLTGGTLSVDGEEGVAASLQIYPNPVRGTSAISLTLEEKQHVKLRLLDSRGSVISVLNNAEMSAGDHTFRLDSRGLSSGAYYLILEKGGEKEIYPVVVNR